MLRHLALCNQVEHREIEKSGSKTASICRYQAASLPAKLGCHWQKPAISRVRLRDFAVSAEKILVFKPLVLKDLINECKMAAFSLPSPQVPSDSTPGVRSNPVGNRANSPFLSAISIYLDAQAVPCDSADQMKALNGRKWRPWHPQPWLCFLLLPYLTQPSLYKWHNDGA